MTATMEARAAVGAEVEVEAVPTEQTFEIRRRTSLYVLLVLGPLAVAAGFAWFALDLAEPLLWVPCVLFALLALTGVPGLLDARTPLFVADAHGVRMRSGRPWVGLLWREIADIRVEPREGRHDACVKVVSPDGSRVHRAPVGFGTTVSVGEAEVQLAKRRAAAAY